MNTCSSCIWWQEYPNRQWMTPELTDAETTTRTCKNPRLNAELSEYGKLLDDAGAAPTASDDHGISFETGRNFGCIHHTES